MSAKTKSPATTQITQAVGEVDVDRVLDLTFLDIRDESEFTSALSDKIHQYRARSPTRRFPSPSSSGVMGEMTISSSPSKEKSRYAVSDRRKIRAIRLGNNYIPRLDILFSSSQFLRTENILWLDLSFNHITKLCPDLARYFPNVRTINLHANQISSLPEIKNFANLTELHSLTLYGNPVEGKKHYRNFTLYYCNKLQQFDKSPVTSQQRQKMEVWAQTFRKKLNPEEEED
jgi:Leucine-rich repeat (LRR) protein